LISGSAVSQAIIILASPILTRLYSPEEFGIFSVFIAFVTFFSISIFLRYELAASLINSLRNIVALVKLCLIIGTTISGLLIILLYFNQEAVIAYLGWQESSIFLIILPITIFSLGLINFFHFWLVKTNQFKIMAGSKILQSGFLTLIQLTSGFFKFGSIGLIIGHFAGAFITAVSVGYVVFRTKIFAIRKSSFKSIKNMAIRYVNFPKFTVLSDSFLILGTQSPPIIIASVFSFGSAGLFLLAFRCSIAPVALVAQSIGKVFMSRALRLRARSELCTFVKQVYLILLRLSIIPFLILGIVSVDLVSLIFGETWADAGVFLMLLLPCVLGMFIFVPVMTLFIVLEKQKMEMNFQILILTARLIGMLIGVYFSDINLSILLYSALAFCAYFLTGLWIMGEVNIKPYQVMVSTTKEAIISLILILPFYLIYTEMIGNSMLNIFSKVIILVITLCLFSIRLQDSLTKLNEPN